MSSINNHESVKTSLIGNILKRRVEELFSIIGDMRNSVDEDQREIASAFIIQDIQKQVKYLSESGYEEEEVLDELYSFCCKNNLFVGKEDDEDNNRAFINQAFSTKTVIDLKIIEDEYQKFIKNKEKLSKQDILTLRQKLDNRAAKGVEQNITSLSSDYAPFVNKSHGFKIFEFVSKISAFMVMKNNEKNIAKYDNLYSIFKDMKESCIGRSNIHYDPVHGITVSKTESGVPDGLLMVGDKFGMVIATKEAGTEIENNSIIRHAIASVKLIKDLKSGFEANKEIIFLNNELSKSSKLFKYKDKEEQFLYALRNLDEHLNDHLNTTQNYNKKGGINYSLENNPVTKLYYWGNKIKPRYFKKKGYFLIDASILKDGEVKFTADKVKDQNGTAYLLIKEDNIERSQLKKILAETFSRKANKFGMMAKKEEKKLREIFSQPEVQEKFSTFKMDVNIINDSFSKILNLKEKGQWVSADVAYSKAMKSYNKQSAKILEEFGVNTNNIDRSNMKVFLKEMADLGLDIYFNSKTVSYRDEPDLLRYVENGDNSKYTNEEFRHSIQMLAYASELIGKNKIKDATINIDAAIEYVSSLPANMITNTLSNKSGPQGEEKTVVRIENLNNNFKDIIGEFFKANIISINKSNLERLYSEEGYKESGVGIKNINKIRTVLISHINNEVFNSIKNTTSENREKVATRALAESFFELMNILEISPDITPQEFISSEIKFSESIVNDDTNTMFLNQVALHCGIPLTTDEPKNKLKKQTI
jgi:hypothetical protein